METLNTAFFFVCDKLIALQSYFIGVAKGMGAWVLLIAIGLAVINYAMTGQGFKENVIKIVKALIFFWIVIFSYPRIVSFLTNWTFDKAMGSTYSSIEPFLTNSKDAIAENAYEAEENNKAGTYSSKVTKSKKVSEDSDPSLFFTRIIQKRKYLNMQYTTVAPAAAMQAVLLVAGECMRFSEKSESGGITKIGIK